MSKIKFNQSCKEWAPDDLYNKIWINTVEHAVSDKLRANGFATLYDFYEGLGIPIDLTTYMNISNRGWKKGSYISLTILPDPAEGSDCYIIDVNDEGLWWYED